MAPRIKIFVKLNVATRFKFRSKVSLFYYKLILFQTMKSMSTLAWIFVLKRQR